MEKMREEFETWVITRNVCIKYGAKLHTCPDGSYYDYRINDRWLAWKASRSLLNVELPSYQCDQRYKDGVLDANKVFEALEKAGVSYK